MSSIFMAVVTFDYTLSPYGKFPLQICELKAAVRYLRAYAKTYHIDPDHIAYWGLSAGAHIAALAAVSNGVKELEDLSMGKPVKNSEELVYLSNPCNFITEQSPPFFIQHGDADQMVSIKNSRMLYESILEKTGENNQKIYSFPDTYLKVK